MCEVLQVNMSAMHKSILWHSRIQWWISLCLVFFLLFQQLSLLVCVRSCGFVIIGVRECLVTNLELSWFNRTLQLESWLAKLKLHPYEILTRILVPSTECAFHITIKSMKKIAHVMPKSIGLKRIWDLLGELRCVGWVVRAESGTGPERQI